MFSYQLRNKKQLPALPQDFFRFYNLVSLELLDCVCTPVFSFHLRYSPGLRKLTLIWCHPLLPPAVDDFAHLETLRIVLCNEAHPGESYPAIPYWPTSLTVTTLSIHDTAHGSDIVRSFCRDTRFPNLRVLRLDGIDVNAQRVYDFINRHPTLLEVSIGFRPLSSRTLRLEALLKLIDGTGTWIKRDQHPGHLLLDQPTYLDYDSNHPVPADFLWTWGSFFEFSFARVPLLADGTQWDSGMGSQTPRYRCTAFAIKFWTEYNDDSELHGKMPAEAWAFLQEEPGLSLRDSVQELRLSFQILHDQLVSWKCTMMVYLSSGFIYGIYYSS